jgi:hypothetical protein
MHLRFVRFGADVVENEPGVCVGKKPDESND